MKGGTAKIAAKLKMFVTYFTNSLRRLVSEGRNCICICICISVCWTCMYPYLVDSCPFLPHPQGGGGSVVSLQHRLFIDIFCGFLAYFLLAPIPLFGCGRRLWEAISCFRIIMQVVSSFAHTHSFRMPSLDNFLSCTTK